MSKAWTCNPILILQSTKTNIDNKMTHGFLNKIVLPELKGITISPRNITKVLLDLARQAILHTFIFQPYYIYNVR